MYNFIEEIQDKAKRVELIREQNKISFDDYFNKKLGPYLDYYQRVGQKCCIKIITPQQSIFSLVGPSHDKTCNSVLDVAFNGDFQRKDGEKKLIDTENNMKLGNIYIKMYDCDVSTQKRNFPKNIFSDFKKLFSDSFSYVSIMVPENFNQYQIDELRKTIDEINKYDKFFKTQDIGIIHYLDKKLEDKKLYPLEEIEKFINETNGDANKFIKEVEINPNEQVIVDTRNQNVNNNRAEFLDSLNSKPNKTFKSGKIEKNEENNKGNELAE